MTKYRFHTGDRVKAGGDPAKRPVLGTVISFSRGGNINWYKVSSRGEVYNCREDELELLALRRKPVADQHTLVWYRPEDVLPEDVAEKGELYLGKFAIVTVEDDPVRHPELTVVSYMPGGEDVPSMFVTPVRGGDLRTWAMDDVLLWAHWIWPEYPVEKGGEDDETDPDD